MLQLHAKDPSLRVHGIKDVGAFVHRTLSVTHVHLNIIHISAQGRGTRHPTLKLPLRVFTKKGSTFCSTGLIRFLQKNLIYVSRM